MGARTSVYLARPAGCSPHFPADYVVKVLMPPHDSEPSAVELIRREAHVGRHVSHRHVVSILAARIDRPPYFIVMPRLDGVTLRVVLDRAERLVCPRALWIARQLAEGLGALHSAGWIHGDLKPENILISPHGHVTLLDLGFARGHTSATRDGNGALMGTLQYAAPESFITSRREDPRSDIYSLGVTLHEMLTGRLPFDDDDPSHLVNAHLAQIPPNPRRLVPQLPRSVHQLLQRILAKDPMRRPQSARELVAWLMKLEIESFGLQMSA